MSVRENLLKQANGLVTNVDRAGGTELFVKTSVIASALCDEIVSPYTVSVVLAGMQMALISCKQLKETNETDWSGLLKDISYMATFANNQPEVRLSTSKMPQADFNLQDVAIKMADQLAVK